MDIQGKIWGVTSEIFSKNNVEVHRIEGNKDSFCSKHKHEHKFNMFFVERGIIKVERWKEYKLVDITILKDGQSCVVPPGEYHRFSVIDDCVAYEFYWVEIGVDDIVRENIGGIKK